MLTLIIRIRTAFCYAWHFRHGDPEIHLSVRNSEGQNISEWVPEYSELIRSSIYYGLYEAHRRKVLNWKLWQWLHLQPIPEDDKQLEFDF